MSTISKVITIRVESDLTCEEIQEAVGDQIGNEIYPWKKPPIYIMDIKVKEEG